MEDKTKEAIERVQTARDPARPYSLDLFSTIFSEFLEIHGDRRFADDAALIAGFARIGPFEAAVLGQQKGRDTNQRRFRNFGMPKPEGYRKALRTMKLAEKFGRPIVCFIDTPGAYPGIDAEERGQAEAIAFNLREMVSLKVPTVVVVLGEGGSGGALAIGVGDRVLMLENAVYSVISPEGCAAILWKDAAQAGRAAASLRLTADELLKYDLIDEIIPEESEAWKLPDATLAVNAASMAADEAAPENYLKTADRLKNIIVKHLTELSSMDEKQRKERRFQKFRKMGVWHL